MPVAENPGAEDGGIVPEAPLVRGMATGIHIEEQVELPIADPGARHRLFPHAKRSAKRQKKQPSGIAAEIPAELAVDTS